MDAVAFSREVRARHRALAPLWSQLTTGPDASWPSREEVGAHVEALEEALRTWTGTAYADLGDHPDVLADRAALDELRATAQEDTALGLLALGEHAAVLAATEQAGGRNPLRERTRSLQALALVRTGRQVEALEVLRGYRELLADELGLDPGPEVRALEEAVLRQSPSLGAWLRPEATSARPAAVTTPPSAAGATATDADTGGAHPASGTASATATPPAGTPCRMPGARPVSASWPWHPPRTAVRSRPLTRTLGARTRHPARRPPTGGVAVEHGVPSGCAPHVRVVAVAPAADGGEVTAAGRTDVAWGRSQARGSAELVARPPPARASGPGSRPSWSASSPGGRAAGGSSACTCRPVRARARACRDRVRSRSGSAHRPAPWRRARPRARPARAGRRRVLLRRGAQLVKRARWAEHVGGRRGYEWPCRPRCAGPCSSASTWAPT